MVIMGLGWEVGGSDGERRDANERVKSFVRQEE
jgi:hypothetical protein